MASQPQLAAGARWSLKLQLRDCARLNNAAARRAPQFSAGCGLWDGQPRQKSSSSDSLDAAARGEAEIASSTGGRRSASSCRCTCGAVRGLVVLARGEGCDDALVLILVSTSLILVEAEVVHRAAQCELIGVPADGAPLHAPPLPLWMFVVDTVCIAAFTAELLLRTVAAPATIGLRRFLCSPANWVDVAAILPYFLELPTSDFVPRPDGGDDDGAGGVAALSVLRHRLARLRARLQVVSTTRTARRAALIADHRAGGHAQGLRLSM